MPLGPRNQAAFVCAHVFAASRPILLVSRAGGDWQFLCGDAHPGGSEPRVIGIGHLLDRDPTLLELDSLPENWEAERNAVGGTWRKAACDDD